MGISKRTEGRTKLSQGWKKIAKQTIFRCFCSLVRFRYEGAAVTLAADYSKWKGGAEKDNIKRGLLKRCLNDLIHPPPRGSHDCHAQSQSGSANCVYVDPGWGARFQRVSSQFGAEPRWWHQFNLHKKASAGGWLRVRVKYSYLYPVL